MAGRLNETDAPATRLLAVTGGTLFLTLWVLKKLPFAATLPVCICAAVVCAVVAAVRRLRRQNLLLHVCAVILAGCVLFQVYYRTVFLPVRALDGAYVHVTASLGDLPYTTDSGCCTMLRTDSVDGVPLRCRMYLYSKKPPQLSPGQTVSFASRVYASDTPESTGVWLRTYATDDVVVTEWTHDFAGRMLRLRQYAVDTLLRALPGTNGAVLAAMLTGERSHIPDDVYARMRDCGIVHIFCVSGLHLSVFSMLLYRFLDRRRVPRVLTVAPSAVLVLLFMAITGFPRSCVRAGIMLLILLFGRIFLRRSDAVNALGASLTALCLFDPFCADDAGLQLSALGTLGVVLCSPVAEDRLKRLSVRPRFLRTGVQTFLSAMLVTACVWALTLPVVVTQFGRVSLVSPAANACLLFAAEWAMIGAAVAVLLSAVPALYFLYRPALFAAGLLAKYCTAVADFFGGFRFAAVRADFDGLRLWIAGTLILAVAAVWFRGSVLRRIALCATISLSVLAVILGFHAWDLHETARITLLDTGNRSAVLLQSRGEAALVGCGAGASRGVRRYADALDLLVVPRSDPTECGGADALNGSVPCGEIWTPARTLATEPLFRSAEPRVLHSATRTVGDIRLTYRNEADTSAVFVQIYGKTALLLFAPGSDLRSIPRAWLDADMLISRSDVPQDLAAQKYALVLLARDRRQGDAPVRQILDRGGTAAATAGEGDLCLQIGADGSIGLQRRDSDA